MMNFVIKENRSEYQQECGVCGILNEFEIGPEVYVDGADRPLCAECSGVKAPELHRARMLYHNSIREDALSEDYPASLRRYLPGATSVLCEGVREKLFGTEVTPYLCRQRGGRYLLVLAASGGEYHAPGDVLKWDALSFWKTSSRRFVSRGQAFPHGTIPIMFSQLRCELGERLRFLSS